MGLLFKAALSLIGKIAEKAAEELDKSNTYTPYAKKPKKDDEISEGRYLGRKELTEFEVPEGIVKIGRSAFRDCKNLVSIKLPSTLKYIGGNAFTGCSSLTEIIVPEGVTYIDNGAFSECSSLVTAVLPQSLNGTEIHGGLFYRCPALENVVFPKHIIRSFANVFPHCESLKSFEIPYGADELGAFTFEYCYGLERLIIPDTVKYIGHRSIMYCNSLKEIYIPDSVERIACLHTFYRCDSLSKVRLPLVFTFRDILDDDTEDKAALCFDGCSSLHTVEMCGREFHIDKMNDEALLLIRAELAADGYQLANGMVMSQIPQLFKALADHDRRELTGKILKMIPRESVSPADLITAIDYAAEAGAHEIYLMLVHFKNGGESPPEDTGIEQRFSL